MSEEQVDAVVRTVDRLARIEVKLDQLREERSRIHERIDDEEKRLGRVERFMWVALGMASASITPHLLRYASLLGV